MNSLWNDLLFARRVLLKSGKFTVAVVVTLAIGIASNTIIFDVARSIFFRGVSYPYFPYMQRPNPGVTLAVRTHANLQSTSNSLRSAVLSLDPTLPVYDLALLDARLAEQVAPVRTMAIISSAYALLAVLAHDVGQRTQEIGIRMALGALPRSVLLLVLREGLLLTLAGLAVGVAGAMLTTRMMQALLFGVSPTEPAVFLAIAALLLFVAVLACWVPARRAMRLDPLQALRQD